MHVIWKRPDGYLDAAPTDYHVVTVGTYAKLWLHKVDCENFPFRVSGGWQDEELTIRINRFVNLLGKPKEDWCKHLSSEFAHSKSEDKKEYLVSVQDWLAELSTQLKGDHWEMEIMKSVFDEIRTQIKKFSAEHI